MAALWRAYAFPVILSFMFSHTRRHSFLFFALLLALVACAAPAVSADEGLTERTEIFLIYKGGAPIGYSHTTLKKLQGGDPKFARWAIESEIYMRISIKNAFRDTLQRSAEIIGGNLRLLEMESALTMGKEKYELTAKSDNSSLFVTSKNSARTHRTETPYPMGAVPVSAAPLLLARLDLENGPESRVIKVVNPGMDRLSISEMAVFIEGRAPVTQDGKVLDAILLRTEMDGLETFMKMDAKGAVYECVQPAVGIKQVRVSARDFQAVKEFESWDVTDSSVLDAGRRLPNSETLAWVDADITWNEKAELTLTSAHQKVRSNSTSSRGPYRASVRVTREPQAPDKAKISDAERRACLAADSKIQSTHEAVRDAAAEAAGKETGALKQAQLIARWIHENIRPDPATWNNDHAAATTLARGAGMNKHVAILFAAMARSRGIPVRVATGVIYTGGLLIAHFWNEAYIDGSWVTVDATAPDPMRPAPVRIKLAQGPNTEIAGDRAAPAIKSLRIDITGSGQR